MAGYLCKHCCSEDPNSHSKDCPINDLGGRDPLLQEREKTHGSFAANAKMYCAFVRAIIEVKEGGEDRNDQQILATQMILLKLARMLSGQPMTKDHWDDIAGYAKLGSEACE